MMGDAGSIPLGFLTGALMLQWPFRATRGGAHLPAYFCIDATITLVRRLAAGHRFHDSHREHFYQRAAAALPTHAPVVIGMIVASAGLIAAALISRGYPIVGLILGGMIMAGFFAGCRRRRGRRSWHEQLCDRHGPRASAARTGAGRLGSIGNSAAVPNSELRSHCAALLHGRYRSPSQTAHSSLRGLLKSGR